MRPGEHARWRASESLLSSIRIGSSDLVRPFNSDNKMDTTNKITLTGKQLIDALSLITGGGDLRNLTTEELETEIDIQHMEEWRDDEVGLNPAGLYANLSEYPEDGVYGPLGDTHEAKEITDRANVEISHDPTKTK